MSKSRIAILMLLFVTVIYAVSLTLVWWRYTQMPTEGYDERLGHYFVTRKSFLNTRGGFLYLCAGAVLALMWIALTHVHTGRMNEKANGESVGGVSPPSACLFFCFLLLR